MPSGIKPYSTSFCARFFQESNLIEGIDSPKALTQSLDAWEFLKTRKKLLTKDVLKAHKMISEGFMSQGQPGFFRDIDVCVDYQTCPSPYVAKKVFITALREFYAGPVGKDIPLIAHVIVEGCHPFADGNGRTGRLMMLWSQYVSGHKPTLFLASERREKYYKYFGEWKPLEAIEWLRNHKILQPNQDMARAHALMRIMGERWYEKKLAKINRK